MLVTVYLQIIFYTPREDVKGASSDQHPDESREIIHEHRKKDITIQKMGQDDTTNKISFNLEITVSGMWCQTVFRWRQQVLPKHLSIYTTLQPVPVAARSKARVCGRLPAGIAGSNPSGGMDVCLS